MAVSQQHQPQEPHINGGVPAQPPISSTTMPENFNFTTKRQRRPSVRLVEIGDQPTKHWKPSNRPSKTRPLTNLSEPNQGKGGKNDVNSDNLALGSWRIKGFDHSKRPRTNWVSRNLDQEGGGGSGDDGFSRGFEMEGSESPLSKANPVHDSLNEERDLQFKGVDLEGPSDNGGNSVRGWGGGKVDGVRVWLDELGLGRYWPVFEFHEVDDEVLPLLTLEDLKDMGIHAVGSRRKLFCAIQKLDKEFS